MSGIAKAALLSEPRFSTPHRENRLLIVPSFEPGLFDSHAVDIPFVFSLDGRQGMTYVGWDGVGYQTALSWRAGDSWSPGQVIFPRQKNDSLLRYNAALSSIVRDNDLRSAGELRRFDGWFIGTFHAYPQPGFEEGPASIGFVRSRDLVHWERIGSLLRPDDGAAWEQGGLYKSWLLEHAGMFYVFYNAKDRGTWPWREQTGVAMSRDLVTWTRSASNPMLSNGPAGAFDEVFASDPCVLRDGAEWVTFYFGLASDGHARDGYAVSADLHSWQKSSELLLDVGPEGSIDSLHAHKPAMISRNGVLEHYYCAVSACPPKAIGAYLQREVRGIARRTSVHIGRA